MSGSGRGGPSRGGSSRGGSGRGGSSHELPYRGGPPGRDDRSRPSGGRGGNQGGGGGRSGGSSTGSSRILQGNPQVAKETGKFEDNWIAANNGERPEKGQLALRPAYGKQGKKITLRANYFKMIFKPGVKFYSYIATITPEPKPKRHLLEIWQKILAFRNVVEAKAATDYATELVTLKDLGQVPLLRFAFDEPGGGQKNYTVKLVLNGIIDHQQVISGLADTSVRSTITNEAIVVRALNILMAAYPSQQNGVVTLGKGNNNKFYWVGPRQQSSDLGNGLQCIRGYYASVRLAASGVLLNLSVNHSAFYKPGPLVNLWNAVPDNHRSDRNIFGRYVRMLRVECQHLKDPAAKGDVPRIKTIWGLADPDDGRDEDHPPRFKEMENSTRTPEENRKLAFGADAFSVKFYLADEKRWITVAEYFKNKYGMDLKPGTPLLNVGNKARPVYLPMDVLVIPPGRVFRGELNLTQRQGIIKYSCRKPPENYDSIIDHGLEITGAKADKAMGLGLKVEPAMVAVPGRILDAPNLKYGAGKVVQPKGGSWNLMGTKFVTGSKIELCAGVVIRTSRGKRPGIEPLTALEAFKKSMEKSGLTVKSLITQILTITLDDNYKQQLVQINELMAKLKQRSVDLAVIIMPSGVDRIFDHIKWRADTVDGVVTHCCAVEKITPNLPPNEQYLANNAMKVNLRLGGVNQTLDMPAASPLIAAGKTMVVGLDVTHPSATDPDTFPSIASIVASTDALMGQWPGQVKIQDRRKEIVQHLVDMMLARLRRWKKDNSELPENIIVFRDGVSEGQYQTVLAEELPQVRKACESIYTTIPRPNITILVGGKRHNTRFFVTTPGDRNGNCFNGTVVDRVVTRPIYWEFFLQAQTPIQGSARSAHYVVIHDEIFTNPKLSRVIGPNASDAIQELTHNICYMMGRCTRSISYSTPAFLADRFADRARKYVRAYYYEQQTMRGNFRPPVPPDGVTVLAPKLSESMVYI